MQIIFLPTVWTIIIDCVAWAIIQPFIAWLGIQFPPQWIQPDLWLYKERSWEKEGMLYQKLFRVRSWKAKLPDGGSLFRDDFKMSELGVLNEQTLQRWILETCRSELVHWFAMFPAGLFFLWNKWQVGIVMIIYAFTVNIIPIIVQRYNRPRLKRLLDLVRKKNIQQPFVIEIWELFCERGMRIAALKYGGVSNTHRLFDIAFQTSGLLSWHFWEQG